MRPCQQRASSPQDNDRHEPRTLVCGFLQMIFFTARRTAAGVTETSPAQIADERHDQIRPIGDQRVDAPASNFSASLSALTVQTCTPSPARCASATNRGETTRVVPAIPESDSPHTTRGTGQRHHDR